ncbi:MAG: hypothetical protein M0R66_01200 [Candidatus Omnitrophica bacterium]|nr:hypothetical protein [Candidatus Omnitrophota bacterium]
MKHIAMDLSGMPERKRNWVSLEGALRRILQIPLWRLYSWKNRLYYFFTYETIESKPEVEKIYDLDLKTGKFKKVYDSAITLKAKKIHSSVM